MEVPTRGCDEGKGSRTGLVAIATTNISPVVVRVGMWMPRALDALDATLVGRSLPGAAGYREDPSGLPIDPFTG